MTGKGLLRDLGGCRMDKKQWHMWVLLKEAWSMVKDDE
jgi:hypothetical protein